jgi:site-specific recombinase XerD
MTAHGGRVLKKAPPTQKVIDEFVQTARARNCSKKFVDKIRYHLAFLERAHPTLPTTTSQLNAFMAAHHEQRKANGDLLSEYTRQKTWVTIRALYAWISETYPGAPNPAAKTTKPGAKKTLPRVLTQHDVDRILSANERHPREFALVALMLDTMARLGEAAPLTWEHIKFEGTEYEVHFPRTGKQGARTAPIHRDTFTALRMASRAGGLWQKSDSEPLTYYGVRRAFRCALGRAGIKGNPHLMRHTAATLYVKNGGDLFSLMRIGGWTNLESVQMYVHLANSDIRDQYNKHSVMARRATQGGTQLRLLQEAQ